MTTPFYSTLWSWGMLLRGKPATENQRNEGWCDGTTSLFGYSCTSCIAISWDNVECYSCGPFHSGFLHFLAIYLSQYIFIIFFYTIEGFFLYRVATISKFYFSSFFAEKGIIFQLSDCTIDAKVIKYLYNINAPIKY